MNNYQEALKTYSELLPLGKSISFTDAEKRAATFLEAMANVATWRHELGEEKIRLTSTVSAVFHQMMAVAGGKTMTESKAKVEGSLEHSTVREELERIENDISYLKAYYDIFNNAHIFYRNMAKGDGV